ncbi:MAG: hypothetical protein ACI3XR_10495 [Eubacteriales bacterium]
MKVWMRYENLCALIRGSSGSRRFFFTLSVEDQLAMQSYGDFIHTAEDLHRYADAAKEDRRRRRLSGYCDREQ